MAALRLRELVAGDDPPRLARVVVLDRSLEPFAKRLGLAQLPPQPAEQADLRGAAYSASVQIASRRSIVNPSRK